MNKLHAFHLYHAAHRMVSRLPRTRCFSLTPEPTPLEWVGLLEQGKAYVTYAGSKRPVLAGWSDDGTITHAWVAKPGTVAPFNIDVELTGILQEEFFAEGVL